MTRLAQLNRQERGPTLVEATDYLPSSDVSWRGDELDSDTLRNIAILISNQNLSPSRVRTGIAPSSTTCDSFSRLCYLVTGLVEQGWAGKIAQHIESKNNCYHLDFNMFNTLSRVERMPSNQLVVWHAFEADSVLGLNHTPSLTAKIRAEWLDLAEITPNELTFHQMDDLIDLLSADLHNQNFDEIGENLEIANISKMSADAVVVITRLTSTEAEKIQGWKEFIQRAALEMDYRGEDSEIMAGLL